MPGRVGNPSLIPEIRKIKAQALALPQKEVYFSRSWLLLTASRAVLAKFGSAEDQQEIRDLLKSEDIQMVREGIDHIQRVGPTMVKELLPLLEDKRKGIDMGASHAPVIVRVCDYAAVTLAIIYEINMPPMVSHDAYMETIKKALRERGVLKR